MESRKRSLAKTISWQLLHMSVVAGVAFLITGEIEVAGALAVLELIWETTAFYLHERAWAKWGKIK